MVEPGPSVPDRGDVVWIDLKPRIGHEQSGQRPAIVLSPQRYNRRVGLALVCPITRQAKEYPFEVNVPAGLPISGVVLADQVRCVDWRASGARFICRLPVATVDEVLGKTSTLLS